MFFGRKPRPESEHPFQAIVRAPTDALPEADPPSDSPETDAEWSVDDIEAAYQRALDAAESVAELTEPAVESSDAEVALPETADAISASSVEPPLASGVEVVVAPADETEAPRVTSRQIVEALLFVGGRPLTSRQVADVLGGSCTNEFVDDLVTDLNAEYSRQERPYEIRLGEGGYRLDLKPAYEKVRARVFGVGPREVKLAQNALEVLALIAYQQPVSREDLEGSGVKGAGGLVRQLLRRELVSLERGEGDQPDRYRTTGRFLELFGLRSLADLPRPEAVSVR